ncbi:pentapeptide repeat-containing protein [Rothia dentocariosa]|uniref:pentapeptide repeat-containing protein n=1 Tax=Rothia dentocariosa TaxID=2047 RepID=UPI003C78EBB7
MPKEREDVEATVEQGTTPDASQQKGKWRAIDWIAGGTVIAEVLWGLWWLVTQVFSWCSWTPPVNAEHFAQFYCGVGLGILSFGYLILILWPIIFKQGKGSKQDNDPRWFHARILSSGIVGGSYAFLLPVVMSLPEGNVNSGGAAALRQAILLATGGLIALIALGETRRKNDNDREAAENLRTHQENMLIQQKEQFEANAFKERKAERRERYTKAIEQLGDEKSSVRMGGVYTLVGLVDEWLEEESIRKYEDRLKEGQVIINNLCAYIRSTFTLASHYDELSKDSPTASYKDREQEFYTDKAEFKAEADVRRGIIKEIHSRLRGAEINTPGVWSEFEYDFSGSAFFYPVDLTNSYYMKTIKFDNSKYYYTANFSNSIYTDNVSFYGCTYSSNAIFSESTYNKEIDFYKCTYRRHAYFRNSTYIHAVNFSNSIFNGELRFSGSIFFNKFIFSSHAFDEFDDLIDKSSRFTFDSSQFDQKSLFYENEYHKNTLFGSKENNFYVYYENIDREYLQKNLETSEGVPSHCCTLTHDQRSYLDNTFQKIGKVSNRIIESIGPEEKGELSDTLRNIHKELHKWREQATKVKVQDSAIGSTENSEL